MAYSSGDTILDDHYNIFAQGGASSVDHNTANINTVWGSGTGDKGWGQSGTISTVSAGSTITATQWVNLLNRVSAEANHQGTSIVAISNPAAGDTISAYSNLSNNIADVYGKRGNCAAVGTSITASGSRSGTNTWYNSQSATFTVTFGSAAQLRYFFNAGGRIGLNFSRSGGTSNNKNTGWSNLLTSVGTIYLTTGTLSQIIAGTTYTGTTKVGGSGTDNILASTTGAYDLTTSNVNIYRKYDSTYLYTSNYITIAAKANAAAYSATSITFTVTLTDAAADTSSTAVASVINFDKVDGTLTGNIFASPPGTTYISNTWGTPTLSTTAWSGS
jgi:hypothetical protein